MRDLQRALLIVAEFGKLSWAKSDWERMVAEAELPPAGCLLDALDLKCPSAQRKAMGHYAATALRQAYPQYTRGQAAWRNKHWTRDDLVEIIAVVERTLIPRLQQAGNAPLAATVDTPRLRDTRDVQSNGFYPWVTFRNRPQAPQSPGVYVFGHFPEMPPAVTNPLDQRVIYIGKSDGQTIEWRLQQFAGTVDCEIGHSGGFSYRLEFHTDDYEAMRSFKDIYITWQTCQQAGIDNAREIERTLIDRYCHCWGKLPQLNKCR
jgi:hypothetical protein